MNKIWIILSLVTLFIFDLKSQDTIHVISYNLLNYDSSTDRNNEFKKIFQFLKHIYKEDQKMSQLLIF